MATWSSAGTMVMLTQAFIFPPLISSHASALLRSKCSINDSPVDAMIVDVVVSNEYSADFNQMNA